MLNSTSNVYQRKQENALIFSKFYDKSKEALYYGRNQRRWELKFLICTITKCYTGFNLKKFTKEKVTYANN